jgi:DNA-directed RNA polymerase subunit M/transcription elongation factor TFIIS
MLVGTNLRKKTQELLFNVIQDDYIVTNLERGIYNYSIWRANSRNQPCSWESINFRDIYTNKLKHIYANLCPDNYVRNPNLLHRLKNKEMLPHEIAFASPCELFPEHWDTIIREKKERDAKSYEIDLGQATNQFTCGRCKGTKTTYYTMQTRSADEAETVFVTCLMCGKRWRK